MQATTPKLNSVFSRNRILRIPFYQRQYVWEEKDWARFLDDMCSLIENDTDYFLGALIVKEETISEAEKDYGINERLAVVDGQQRLTTMCIFLKVLHLLTDTNSDFDYQFRTKSPERDPVLRHSYNDRPAFLKIMDLETLVEAIPGFEDKNIVKAYQYFRKNIKAKNNAFRLLNSVESHVSFVEIKLHQPDNEQQIFDTINSLGVDLTTDELLKNFLYEPQDEEAYLQNWKPTFDDDVQRKFWGTDDASRRQAKTAKTKTIETFILHFVKIQMWKYREKFAPNDRKRLVSKNDLFESCKAFVLRFDEDKQDLANEIIAYAKLYMKYFDKENLNKRLPSTPCIERLACYAMAKETTIIPYLLYIEHNVDDQQERNKIYGYLEKYLMRRLLSMPNTKNKNYVEFFSETLVGNCLNTYDKLKKHIEDITEDKNHAMPSDDFIKQHVASNALDDDMAKIVLYMWETQVVYNRDAGGYNQYQVHAIMPKPSLANQMTWPAHEDENEEVVRKNRIKTIGNYLLLHDADKDHPIKADSVKDLSFTDKVGDLKTWSRDVRVSNSWFTNLSSWNENRIVKRSDEVAQYVIARIWALD